MSAPRLLTPNRRRLLADLVGRRAPHLEAILAKLEKVALTEDDRDALRNVVIAELCDRGLKVGDEPNEYGFVLEGLIDDLGHIP